MVFQLEFEWIHHLKSSLKENIRQVFLANKFAPWPNSIPRVNLTDVAPNRLIEHNLNNKSQTFKTYNIKTVLF